MHPTAERIVEFLTFAPEAGEGKAFVFLENAKTIEEAVTAYYDNPNKYDGGNQKSGQPNGHDVLPTYQAAAQSSTATHTNEVIRAAHVRAQDEQEMQNLLQTLQFQYRIYNSDIEPEHEIEGYCSCPIHQYQQRKWNRRDVQDMWSKAVMYPGERAYNNLYQTSVNFFSGNPYRFNVTNPFGLYGSSFQLMGQWRPPQPIPRYYTLYVQDTIYLNNNLNAKAQRDIDAQEPEVSIWEVDQLADAAATMSLESEAQRLDAKAAAKLEKKSEKKSEKQPEKLAEKRPEKQQSEKQSETGREKDAERPADEEAEQDKPIAAKGGNRKSWFKKMVQRKTPEEKEAKRLQKLSAICGPLRNAILQEEHGRWPTQEWRRLAAEYQEKVGMTRQIAHLRYHRPTQYLHLLRAGYFEPIPVAWADQASNPLKFSIEAIEGWRGITPAWRGYEDTAEERLYWVLNHREGSTGQRMKPDMISALNMARQRMASAVEPPPQYYDAGDTCHTQHISDGYSRQVMPPPFQAYDAPETAADDTMILLDVSGSMDFDPVRPNYNEYLITGYVPSTQPKNKDVARAIIRRFVDAMINHSHSGRGYQLTTFANHASYIGVINHANFDSVWRNVHFGGQTRVMTGWQRCKRLHFEKHRESATHHPVYGWQAGPKTPMLRLLLLLDGEATDMDEFELDLLGNEWAHVTIFLIGVDGCPHHHRHANELQRISEVNHHVSFVDAQGNMPERLVTHELLKRHLGYEVSMAEFQELELPPAYSEV